MRAIPEYSTDLLYSRHFKREDLVEVGNAIGTSDIKNITTATLDPERILYHACLNGIQSYLKLNAEGEAERAKEIADLADTMYAALYEEFKLRETNLRPQLTHKTRDATHFCDMLHAIEADKPWNKKRYENVWNTNDYPQRWQKKAIETYGIIRERIANGDYAPPPEQTSGSLMKYWSLRNLEYKHYRDVARTMVESYIHAHFSAAQFLSMQPSTSRLMTTFIGGMGAGKSAMMEYYLGQLPEDKRTDLVLHNADYLKYALYRSAVREGMLPTDHHYAGAEVQAESSNALYEGTRKRAYLARQKFHAPNTVLNSIVLGSFEVQEGIAGGGKIVAHHIYISPEEAMSESRKRQANLGRAPSEADIDWSTAASAKSLFLLTQPEYQHTDVTVHLYHRSEGKAPQHYGTIDAAKSIIYIHDTEKLAALSESACPSSNKQDALKAFLSRFADAGFSVALMKDASLTTPAAILEADKKLIISDAAIFEQNTIFKDTLRSMAHSTQLGNTISISPTADTRGVIYAGR